MGRTEFGVAEYNLRGLVARWFFPRFDDLDNCRVLVVECSRAQSPVFVKDGNNEHFYIRTGAATAELPASQMQEFIRKRFAA